MNVAAKIPQTFHLEHKQAQKVVAIQVTPRMEVFRRLVDDIPRNDYELPQYLYAPAYISEDFFELEYEAQVSILNCAVVRITYDEGFPAFNGGTPIWSQMPEEPDSMYEAFQAYIKQTETLAIRQLAAVTHHLHGMPDLQQGHLYYSWAARSRAFDLYHIAAHQKMRERRILSTNDQVFLKAESLLKGLDVYFNMPGDEEGTEDEEGNIVQGSLRWLEELTPAVALKFMETLNKVQRMSLGLSASGQERTSEDAPKNADIGVLLQTLAAGGLNSNATSDEEVRTSVETLLSDPATAELAQRLLVQSSIDRAHEGASDAD